MQQNIRTAVIWRGSILLFNLVAWNTLLLFFVSLNYLINPHIFTTGPRMFQLMSEYPLMPVSLASIVAFIIWLIEDIILYRYLSKLSLGITFIIRLLLMFFAFSITSMSVGIYYYYYFDRILHIDDYIHGVRNFLFNEITLYFFLIGLVISLIITLFKLIRQKVGYEMFFLIASGHFKIPREEHRIFIFIDLFSSTAYAEQLGHQKYSAFIQDCFNGIGLLEMKYRASQYQFVGDEVVLSWTAKKPKNYKYAVDFFFEFRELLAGRSAYFMQEYGIVPNFSASINSGKVMMAEVGDLKSEIAFHGDVLNTAARIQKQCKKYKASFLGTAEFCNQLKKVTLEYDLEYLDKVKLVGKKEPVDIYSIKATYNMEEPEKKDLSDILTVH